MRRHVGLTALMLAAVVTLVVVATPLAVMSAWGDGSDDLVPASGTDITAAGLASGTTHDPIAAVETPAEDPRDLRPVASKLPAGFYLVEELQLSGPEGAPESSKTVFLRGTDPDEDEDWAIIRVRWFPGLALDVDSWTLERDHAEATTVRGLSASAEIANPASPDDGVKVLRFAMNGGVVLVTGNGPITIDDLKVVAEGLEFVGVR